MVGADAAGRTRQPLPRQPAPRAHDHLPLRWLNSGIRRMAEVDSELDVSAFVRFAVLRSWSNTSRGRRSTTP